MSLALAILVGATIAWWRSSSVTDRGGAPAGREPRDAPLGGPPTLEGHPLALQACDCLEVMASDSVDRRPIPGARVAVSWRVDAAGVQQGGEGAALTMDGRTSASGTARFEDPPRGLALHIRVDSDGHAPAEVEHVVRGGVERVTVHLTPVVPCEERGVRLALVPSEADSGACRIGILNRHGRWSLHGPGDCYGLPDGVSGEVVRAVVAWPGGASPIEEHEVRRGATLELRCPEIHRTLLSFSLEDQDGSAIEGVRIELQPADIDRRLQASLALTASTGLDGAAHFRLERARPYRLNVVREGYCFFEDWARELRADAPTELRIVGWCKVRANLTLRRVEMPPERERFLTVRWHSYTARGALAREAGARGVGGAYLLKKATPGESRLTLTDSGATWPEPLTVWAMLLPGVHGVSFETEWATTGRAAISVDGDGQQIDLELRPRPFAEAVLIDERGSWEGSVIVGHPADWALRFDLAQALGPTWPGRVEQMSSQEDSPHGRAVREGFHGGFAADILLNDRFPRDVGLVRAGNRVLLGAAAKGAEWTVMRPDRRAYRLSAHHLQGQIQLRVRHEEAEHAEVRLLRRGDLADAELFAVPVDRVHPGPWSMAWPIQWDQDGSATLTLFGSEQLVLWTRRESVSLSGEGGGTVTEETATRQGKAWLVRRDAGAPLRILVEAAGEDRSGSR